MTSLMLHVTGGYDRTHAAVGFCGQPMYEKGLMCAPCVQGINLDVMMKLGHIECKLWPSTSKGLQQQDMLVF